MPIKQAKQSAHANGSAATMVEKQVAAASAPARASAGIPASSVSRSRRSPVVDSIVILGLLALLNFLFYASDPFWLESNPTPLLLLPVLIGGRYGSAAGIVVGTATSALVIATMHVLGTSPGKLLDSYPLTLVALPVTGLICGEIHAFFGAKLRALTERCAHLETENSRCRANLELYADSNVLLQRRLAVHGVRLTSLDSELRRLLAPSEKDLFSESLSLLNRVSEISEAAIYTIDGRRLKRRALLGNGDELPETLRRGRVAIIDQAIKEKQMLTCRELWGETPQLSSRHLAAIPWLSPEGEVSAILVVRRLPFRYVNWQHFAQIETICSWIAQYADLHSGMRAPDGNTSYEGTVALCIDTYRKHALPSAAIHFVAREGGGITQEQLRKSISPLLRPTDRVTTLEGGRPNLAVLLPMGGSKEAEQFAEQVKADLRAECETKLTETEELDSAESFMRRLGRAD